MKRINTRAEAVAYLLTEGVFAKERDWSMGETVLVATPPRREMLSGITTFEKLAYIYPSNCPWPKSQDQNVYGYHLWPTNDLIKSYINTEHGVTLERACEIALVALRSFSNLNA